jgi:glycosyltransferase involved in cell wall biosynthesis
MTHERPSDDPVFDVCVVTTIHAPLDARIYQRELRCLAEAGYRVCLIAPWERPQKEDLTSGWIQTAAPRRRASRLAHGWRTFRTSLATPTRSYHIHDIDFLPWAVLLKLIRGTPVVYDCHENYPEEILFGKPWIPGILRRALAAGTRRVEDWCAGRLGKVIVVVPGLARRFSAVGAHAVLVRNLANWTPQRTLPHARALVCIGTLTVAYGMHLLLDIARELRRRGIELPLVLVDKFGFRDEEAEFKSAVRTEKLNIRIHERVPPTEIDRILSQGSIALAVEPPTPSKVLAIPTKLFEYMACGLPIVASALPHSRSILEESGSGLVVEEWTAKAFVDAIVWLLEHPDAQAAFRENGFHAIETVFSWAEEKRRLLELFGDLIGKPQPIAFPDVQLRTH